MAKMNWERARKRELQTYVPDPIRQINHQDEELMLEAIKASEGTKHKQAMEDMYERLQTWLRLTNGQRAYAKDVIAQALVKKETNSRATIY